jgi:hypothetical protein
MFPSESSTGVDHETFSDIMEPFLRSPLQHLGLDNWTEVPESFCTWFDPKLNRWPTLKSLSLKNLPATYGPGDKRWDEAHPEERERWHLNPDDDYAHDVYWTWRSRTTLEKYCEQRGIQLSSEWDWFER